MLTEPATGSLHVETTGTGPPLLEMRHINVAFGGVHAVRDATIDLHEGEVMGLVGGNVDALVAELLSSHYDPTYSRAMTRNYAGLAEARRVTPSGIAPASWRALARSLVTEA